MNFFNDKLVHELEAFDYEWFLGVETEWMVAEGYAESQKVALRKVAMCTILQNSKFDKFDPFIPYLSMNFFDRFISRNRLPNVIGQESDDILLVVNSCLTLAWKMRDTSFSLSEFLHKTDLIEDYREHIIKMEGHILRGINWKLIPVSVTPLSSVKFFVGMIQTGKSIKCGTPIEIIIRTQCDISFTRFKPSVIAASAILATLRFLHSDLYDGNNKIILACKYVKEDDLEACLEKTCEMCIEKKIIPLREDKPKLEVGAVEIDQAGEKLSSSSRRAGKKAIQEQNQDESEGEIDQEMNFELK